MPADLRPALLALLLTHPAQALDLAFPGPAQETLATAETGTAYNLPVGPWDGETFLSRRVEGTLDRRAFRIDTTLSTVDLMAALRPQVTAAGWRILYECDAPVCGGFDFRFASPILPEPEMHVDLGDFRVLSADRGDSALNLIVSRSPRAGFVQLTLARPGTAPAAPNTAATPPQPAPALPDLPDLPIADPPLPDPGAAAVDAPPSAAPGAAGSLVARLQAEGHVVLDDLRFASGAGDLEPGDYPSLAELADWLRQDPARRIALVGHTDASGGLDSNIVLSKRRASAVRARLVGAHDVPPAQVVAQGVGYLAPLAANTTEAGRQRNRRVEAVLLDSNE
jgi:OOP family OmpA-OmpF porin